MHHVSTRAILAAFFKTQFAFTSEHSQIWKVVTAHKRKGHHSISKHLFTQYLLLVQRELVPELSEEDAIESIEVREV